MKIALLATLAILPFTGSAATVFDNGGYNLNGGNGMGDAIQAEDFILGATSNLTGIRFWSLEASGAYLGSITWGIYSDAPGSPSTLLATGNTTLSTVATPDSAFGMGIFQNDFSINVANLVAGTYWLALHDGLSSDVSFQDYYWAYTDPNGVNIGTNIGHEFSLPLGVTWDPGDGEHAFQVFGDAPGAAPEPSTMIMFGGGLLAIAASRIKSLRGGRK
jgi:PEP-CTERM motif